MKRYALIKSYPNCNLIKGTVIYNSVGKGWYCLKDSKNRIYLPNIEDFSEFWQEIVDTSYKILSFIQRTSGRIWLENRGIDEWSASDDYTSPMHISHILTNNLYRIHSVKRLLDEEIFTIGDRIDINRHNDLIISRITICENDRVMITGTKGCASYFEYLKDVKKAKVPILTTNDGVDVYKEDSFIYATDKSFNKIVCFPADIIKNSDLIAFSTESARDEYILWNKPVLSLKDLKENNLSVSTSNVYVVTKGDMLNLVKSKI